MAISRLTRRNIKVKKRENESREKMTDIRSGLDTFHLRRVWYGIRDGHFRRKSKIDSDYLIQSR